MRILALLSKVSFLLTLVFYILISQLQAQNNLEWNLSFRLGIERAKSDLEGCDSCFRYGYSTDGGQTFEEAYPVAKGFYGMSFSFSAHKKFSRYFSFFTGLQYIPSRKIAFSNFPLVIGNSWVLGKQSYIWQHEIEIPALLSFHIPFVKKKLELITSGGINFGLSRRYIVESEFGSTLETWFIRHERNLFQRINPVFDLRIGYNFNTNTSFSISYFTQALLPFIAGAVEEPVFTSGIRFGYQRSLSSITSLFQSKK